MVRKYSHNKTTDLTTTLRSVVTHLNTQHDIQKGGLYHTLLGSMVDRVAVLNLLNVPELLLLMQELRLLRHRGSGNANVWQVICGTFFDEVVSEEWLTRAQSCLTKHKETSDALRVLRARIAELEAVRQSSSAVSVVSAKSIEQIAEMLVTIERLEGKLLMTTNQASLLEQQLRERPAFDADTILADAIMKVRKRTL